MTYCPWENREHVFLKFHDDQGFTSICMICKANIRSNFLEEEE